MLPAHLAENVHKQVLYYLESTFSFRDRRARDAFSAFLQDPEDGLFKGPWVQLRRPFRPASGQTPPPFDIKVPFHPFWHQDRSWRRLSGKGQKPRSTIVTTGTGSGKTECFLYPILDHCLRAANQKQKGIKAIIIYPMNALATDQEARFAEVIWNDPDLKAVGIRVGNYTGRYDPADPGASKQSGTTQMGKDHGITNHAAQQENPPDILLTNYKMLDFLLMRPQDQNLWRHNEPGILRYLVLDELHTYDGAQGSDVACLVRRLKERLGIPKGDLCVVGTSATLEEREPENDQRRASADGAVDAKETGTDRLARFASALFEEDISADAVIGENRLSTDEIVPPQSQDVSLPDPDACDPVGSEDAFGYVVRQSDLWGGPKYAEPKGASEDEVAEAETQWALDLGAWVKKTTLFRDLLHIFERAESRREDPLTWDELAQRLSRSDLAVGQIPDSYDRDKIIGSFLALVAYAKEKRSGKAFPLAPSQVQLWIRELRRLGRVVSDAPRFAWLDEPPPGHRCLPAFHCSECGESGWVALHDPSKDSDIESKGVRGIQLADDPAQIYRGWFGPGGGERKSQHIVVISPRHPEDDVPQTAEDAQPEFEFEQDYLCSESLVLRKEDGSCPLTGDGRRFRVKVSRDSHKTKAGPVIGDQGCPGCGSEIGVFFIGSQAATIASVAIDEMFGSILNEDPKLLSFTDSVQDASHRAGFFTARTFRFTFRTALQHVIEDTGEKGLPLPQAGPRLLEYWSEAVLGRPGNVKQAMAALMPPDLQEYAPYLEFRNDDTSGDPDKSLRTDIEARLTWAATSEFGVMQTHGRTLEPTGSATLGWDEKPIAETIRGLRDRLEGIAQALVSVPDDVWRLWLYGLLHRYRQRGALDHPYLSDYARKRFWGKYPFGRAIPGRETHPHLSRYRPRFLVTRSDAEHEHVLAPRRGNQAPWHLVWTRRALGNPNVDDPSLLDLIHALLRAGEQSGLFRKLHEDGNKAYYAIAAEAAVLHKGGVRLACNESEGERSPVRPESEATFWEGGPSIDYYVDVGAYQRTDFTPRHRYYQDRYQKGALRRVVAKEHTGLLATEDREELEKEFKGGLHADDANVLTCTSTLEMGIDIGDLSSTMLCSIPPNTASYLQRIGRAGRESGTALIISIVNQRPHDLFFYARPPEMLKGRVDPPGCWLDASAVLVRQYLGFCFDSATHTGELKQLPGSGNELVADMNDTNGNLPKMMAWVTHNETALRGRFLKRFQHHVLPDTRDRFVTDSDSDLLTQRMHQAANEHDRTRRDLLNARSRLQNQLEGLEEEGDDDARSEIEAEIRILRGRLTSLSRTSALELLTDHGLLPNYAFPERGVRFYGAIYNKHRGRQQEHKAVEVTRPAGQALRELAPSNRYYTHSRQFDIQQIAIGNPRQSLVEMWAICGKCGHMRRVEDLSKPGASSHCPQCGHGGDQDSQADLGQQRQFLEFAQSQAISYMEHYESLSGDRDDERHQEVYQMVRSFDQTVEAPVGAVGDEGLPFGIEYLAAMVMREANVGHYGQSGTVAFGLDQWAPEDGFQLCRHCGIAVRPHASADSARHRHSCHARRQAERDQQAGKTSTDPFQWEHVYLYRQLRSETIRLLLPLTDDEDIDTLIACLHLGLRLRFEGNPAHLTVAPQVVPDPNSDLRKHYLVLMDAVPGGTGYLKTLYQEKDDQERDGEGILDVFRRARNALETCRCRKLRDRPDEEDTDGCYRCIRTYHLQYRADRISRERGIRLLARLIDSGAKRAAIKALDDIKPDSLFGSVLEKQFVDVLQNFVEQERGTWEKTIIRGGEGFRFSLPDSPRLWELELQPLLGPAQGVMVRCQPDFLLRADDEAVKPVAIFTDGFEFHCHPNNRLADDVKKRRAVLDSDAYQVWSVTWDDLNSARPDHVMVCPQPVAKFLDQASRADPSKYPDGRLIVRNALEQLKAFIKRPNAAGWADMAGLVGFVPLRALAKTRTVTVADLQSALDVWRTGGAMAQLSDEGNAQWVYCDKTSLTQDVISCLEKQDIDTNSVPKTILVARLGDTDAEVSGSDFPERWRRFLACANLLQFHNGFAMWTTSEALSGEAPDLPLTAPAPLSDVWRAVRESTLATLRPIIDGLAKAGVPAPTVEYYHAQLEDDAFAELAWPDLDPPLAVLAGEQTDFANQWQQLGWDVVDAAELQAQGGDWLAGQITGRA